MPPLIVIVGATASGKTALGVELAEWFDGEIICADSRTVYKEMDLGTAKPSPAERARVPHHLLDIITPDQTFSVAQFKESAERLIREIAARGKVPFLVGGSGLYIDAVLYDYQFRPVADSESRRRLEGYSTEDLQQEIERLGCKMPENKLNRRYLIRTLETYGKPSASSPLRANTLIIGLKTDTETLKQRIEDRTDAMIAAGFVQECRHLLEKYGADAPGLAAPGYKAFVPHLKGACTLEEARDVFIRNDTQLAKRQRTWFRRNMSIHWIHDRSNAVDLVTTFLNK